MTETQKRMLNVFGLAAVYIVGSLVNANAQLRTNITQVNKTLTNLITSLELKGVISFDDLKDG